MPIYRKIPSEIEAYELTEENIDEVMEWCGSYAVYKDLETREIAGIVVPTKKSNIRCSFGSYITKNDEGYFSPCKSDIFNKTFEQVNE